MFCLVAAFCDLLKLMIYMYALAISICIVDVLGMSNSSIILCIIVQHLFFLLEFVVDNLLWIYKLRA